MRQVWTLSLACNVIYCLLMLAGFFLIPRNVMLFVGLFTATIGNCPGANMVSSLKIFPRH